MSDLSLSHVLIVPSTLPDALSDALSSKTVQLNSSLVTLNDLLIPQPGSTVIIPVRDSSAIEFGVHRGDLLIVDRNVTPNEGQLVIVSVDDELIINRFFHVGLHNQPMTFSLWGTVTYIISKQG